MPKTHATAYKKRLVAQWQQSHLTKSEFARSQGIVPNTFWSWTRKYGAEQPTVRPEAFDSNLVTTATFVDVTPLPREVPIRVRLGVPGQPTCELDFDTLPPPTWFAAVLREVVAC